MTVSTLTNAVVYRGNGATTQFAVPFKVLDEDHLVVTRRLYTTGAVEYTYVGTDYSYSGIGDSSGTLTLAGTALDDDYELIIERIVPYTQDLDIVNSGGFYPETVEEQLDLIVMEVQQIADLAGRGAVVPVGEEGFQLNKAADRAGKFFAFDAQGNFQASSGTGSDTGLREDLAAPGGADLVNFMERVEFGDGAHPADDSATQTDRTATNPLSGGGSHDHQDLTLYVQSAGVGGYASWDALYTIDGANNTDHAVSFQHRPIIAINATLGLVAGIWSEPTINSGTTNFNLGIYFKDALGAGDVGVQAAVWCEDGLTRGSGGNYCIYNAGAADNYFGTGVNLFGAGALIRIADFATTYGSVITHDAEGDFVDNPNFTIVNGLLTMANATTAKVLATAAHLELDTSVAGGIVKLGGAATRVQALSPFTIMSSPPASAGAAGIAGTITYAAGFLYVCVATNTWQRVAIATW